jgi:hypothetical protein
MIDQFFLWKKYPELERLWKEYIRVCNDPGSRLSQVIAAFGNYERTLIAKRDAEEKRGGNQNAD